MRSLERGSVTVISHLVSAYQHYSHASLRVIEYQSVIRYVKPLAVPSNPLSNMSSSQ